MRIDMCVDMWVDMCVDTCIHMRMHMCMGMCAHMCIHMCYVDTHVYRTRSSRMDVRFEHVDKSVDSYAEVCMHVCIEI